MKICYEIRKKKKKRSKTTDTYNLKGNLIMI